MDELPLTKKLGQRRYVGPSSGLVPAMNAPVILATAAPQAMWFPERIDVVSYAREDGGGGGAVKKAMVGGAVAGVAFGGFVGAAVGSIAAGVASSVASPNTHVEYTLAVTIQGIQMQRQTRWSAAEALVAKMKMHALPEVKSVAEQLPVKFFTLADVGGPEVDARIQKRAAQLGAFFGALCDCWRQICAVHGPTSAHAKLFSDFFELPFAGQDALLSQTPFAAQPEVGAEFGDWRVSGGVLLAMATPVQVEETPAPAPAPATAPPAFAPAVAPAVMDAPPPGLGDLMAMGYTEADGNAALDANDTVEDAADWLVQGYRAQPTVGAAASLVSPVVAAAPAVLPTVQMQCPAGAGPGATVPFMHNGQVLHVQVPQGVTSGGTFEIQLPS